MQYVTVHNKKFVPYLSQSEIQSAVKQLAEKIKGDYQQQSILFIAILNGAFIFAADVFRHMDEHCEISFIKLASYKGTSSTGHVITSIGLDESVHNKHVIILEDIIDTGKTLHTFLPQLMAQQPASLKIAALLHKAEATVYNVPLHYKCFTIPDKFVIGYGLDYDGLGRNFVEIYQAAD